MSCTKKICMRRMSDDVLEDDSDDKDSKRKCRNLSEKKRRDQFNLLVNELSAMVSTVGSRKMDKSTVLKTTISYLKNHNEVSIRSRVHEIQENWKPNFLSNEEFTHLILEAVDGFLVVLGNAGNILYISDSITSLLGYIPDDILGMTIYDLGCAEEQNDIYHILTSPLSEKERPVSFSCHIRRTNYDQRQHPIHELVHFTGYFRADANTDNSHYNAYSEEPNSRMVFIGTGRLQVPHLNNEMRLVDPTIKTEFTSRHSLEWKFLYLDHRASPIIGYLPFELLGTSGYDYYHIDDMDRVVDCHDVLMQKGQGTSCYYRFLTKGQQWIWLQTRFYITYHQWNSKPEFVVCTHQVVSHADVMKNVINVDPLSRDPSPTSDIASPVSWCSRSTRGGIQSSDCLSITSADSAMSRHSCISKASTKSTADGQSSSNHSKNSHSQSAQTVIVSHPQHSSTVQTVTFIEPTQYSMELTAALPTFTGTTAVVSQVAPAGQYSLNQQSSTQMQVDLQRKHAELQAIISQQQAELRRVSEQLLMARLGILQTPQTTTVNTLVSSYNTGTVSSTTGVLIPVSVSGSTNQPNATSSTANETHSDVIYYSSVPDE